MWMCNTCWRAHCGGGYRETVRSLEEHMAQKGCQEAWYSYGGQKADRVTVDVIHRDGEFQHTIRDMPWCRESEGL